MRPEEEEEAAATLRVAVDAVSLGRREKPSFVLLGWNFDLTLCTVVPPFVARPVTGGFGHVWTIVVKNINLFLAHLGSG